MHSNGRSEFRQSSFLGILYICFAFALLLVTSSLPVLAQTNRGGISGTVFDPQGAVVPDATITVINVGTNQKFTTKTTNSGAYVFSNLDPVTYRVEVETPGFRKAVYEGVKVDTATTVTRNVNLLPGSVATIISVEAQAPLMNTESGTQSQTITARQMQEAPLFNRSVLDLALTAPNVSGTAPPRPARAGARLPARRARLGRGRDPTQARRAPRGPRTGARSTPPGVHGRPE